MRVTTSHLSKSVSRLEEQIATSLLVRTSKGVTLSSAAQRLLPHFQGVVTQARALRETVDQQEQLTIAAPLFLLSVIVQPLLSVLPGLRLRTVQLGSDAVSAHAADSLFDMAITMSRTPFSSAWSVQEIGTLKQRLYGSPRLAKSLMPFPMSMERLRRVPFISPLQPQTGKLAPGNDSCPLPIVERRLGHETQTIGIALELATISDQLVFGPQLCAREFLESGKLVEVPVEGWNVNDRALLISHVDRVGSRVQRAVASVIRTALEVA